MHLLRNVISNFILLTSDIKNVNFNIIFLIFKFQISNSLLIPPSLLPITQKKEGEEKKRSYGE